jgi:hypothetical protein
VRDHRSGIGLLVAAVVLTAAVTSAAPVGAQDPPTFPAPLVAAMLSPDEPAALAVRSVYLEPGVDDADPMVVVQFAAPYTLPPDGYRLSVLFGDPAGRSVRTSLRAERGNAVGSVDVGSIDSFAELGPTEVTTTADATARLALPVDVLPESGSMWVVAELADPAATYISPLYPMDQFLGRGPPGALSASSAAWMTLPGDTLPSAVELSAAPVVTVDGSIVTLTYDEPVPTEVGGVLVSTMVDVVRIAPDYLSGGQAPYLVAVDHVTGGVNLLDGTQLIPATLTPSTDEWLLTDLPDRVGPGTVVQFDLALVAEEFGLTTATDSTALGAARSVTLVDGTVVRADGVQGTLSWFESPTEALVPSTDATVAPDLATAAPAADTDAGSGSNAPWLAIIVATLAVLVVAAGWLMWSRRARRNQLDDPTDQLLDSHRSLTLGRQVSPPPLGPDARRESAVTVARPDLDRRVVGVGPEAIAAARAAAGLTPLFDPGSDEITVEGPIDVPDLRLFDASGASPAERPARPRERRPKTSDDLTKALFDADS